jgi:hypothetical protein
MCTPTFRHRRCVRPLAWGISTGGARGADQYALEAVVATGRPACTRSVVFLPGSVSGARTEALAAFQALGGHIIPGAGAGRAALLGRSGRLARESSGVVAFLWGPSRGSVFTVQEAIRAGKPAAVVLAGGGAELPAFSGGQWVACAIGPVAEHRWVGNAGDPDEPERKLTQLGRIFAVPEGEPVQGLMDHIATVSQGERLWFEKGIAAGDTVLIPHEALSDIERLLAPEGDGALLGWHPLRAVVAETIACAGARRATRPTTRRRSCRRARSVAPPTRGRAGRAWRSAHRWPRSTIEERPRSAGALRALGV